MNQETRNAISISWAETAIDDPGWPNLATLLDGLGEPSAWVITNSRFGPEVVLLHKRQLTTAATKDDRVAATSRKIPKQGTVVKLMSGVIEDHGGLNGIVRLKHWKFELFPDEDPLEVTGRETVRQDVPDQGEHFARTLAAKCGWPTSKDCLPIAVFDDATDSAF